MNMMKWKIGVALVLFILFLPMIANAEETTKVYSVEELEAHERGGWKISTGMSYTMPEIISDRAKVGENVLIEGSVQVNMRKETKEETMRLYGPVSNYQIDVFVYRNIGSGISTLAKKVEMDVFEIIPSEESKLMERREFK